MAARGRLFPAVARIRRQYSSSAEILGPRAFVFDIDGVLVKGGEILPQAKEALSLLFQEGTRPRFPLCFMTNGGGVTEERKAAELSEWLQIPVQSSQVVLSHTPFRELARQGLSNRPVLVSGRKQTKEVAQHYGYTNMLTTCELAEAFPHSVPFSLSVTGSGKPGRPKSGIGTAESPIEAVLVFTDPLDWYKDLQLIHDAVTSGGVMGRPPSPEHAGRVRVLFSNPDLLWSNEFPTGRFGQGAFQTAVKALHEEVMGMPLSNFKVFGKPHPEAYQAVTSILKSQASQGIGNAQEGGRQPEFGSIVMIGDNPASDIAGANAAGVFQGGSNSQEHPADYVVNDVLEAVRLALRAEGHHKCTQ